MKVENILLEFLFCKKEQFQNRAKRFAQRRRVKRPSSRGSHIKKNFRPSRTNLVESSSVPNQATLNQDSSHRSFQVSPNKQKIIIIFLLLCGTIMIQ